MNICLICNHTVATGDCLLVVKGQFANSTVDGFTDTHRAGFVCPNCFSEAKRLYEAHAKIIARIADAGN